MKADLSMIEQIYKKNLWQVQRSSQGKNEGGHGRDDPEDTTLCPLFLFRGKRLLALSALPGQYGSREGYNHADELPVRFQESTSESASD